MEVKLSKLEEDMIKRGREGEKAAFESLLSRFNRVVQQSGLFAELKRREYYEKPCLIRRKKLLAAKINQAKKEGNAVTRAKKHRKSRSQKSHSRSEEGRG